MDLLEGKFEHWFSSLSEMQRVEVLTSPGELPSWMVASLQRAGIPPVPVLHSDRSLFRSRLPHADSTP